MAYTNEALGKALEDLTAAYQHFLDKTKDAAIAAIGDTVIAQIKQDAKEHIASELAAQKTALRKAIDAAETALKKMHEKAAGDFSQSVTDASAAFNKEALKQQKELTLLITAAENALNEKGAAALQEIKTASEKEQAHLEKIKETIITEYEKKSKSYTDSMLIKIFQNGYVQWPGIRELSFCLTLSINDEDP